MSDSPRASSGRASASLPRATEPETRSGWLLDDDDADMDFMPAESGEEAESLMDDEYDDGDYHGTPSRPSVATWDMLTTDYRRCRGKPE